MNEINNREAGQARLGPLVLLALGGLLIIGVLVIGLFLLLGGLPPAPPGQETPTPTATLVIQQTPARTPTPSPTPTRVLGASPTPTATAVPSPTPTPVSQIPPTGLGPLEAVIGGALLLVLIFLSRRLRLAG